jgi:hypothetical protein
MKILKLNYKKLLKNIVTGLLFLISVYFVYSTLNPLQFTTGVFKEDNYKGINTKLNPINPTVTYLFSQDPCPKDKPEIKEFDYLVIHPDRQLTGLFKAINNVQGIALCENYQEFLEVVKTKDLSLEAENPDPVKFRNAKIKIFKKNDWFAQPITERYYNIPRSSEVKNSEDINDFKKLKIGMSNEEVEKIVGVGDMGWGKGGVTATNGEVDYVIKKNNINIIATGWESNPWSYKKNQKLLSVWIVYDDRRAEELKLDTIR